MRCLQGEGGHGLPDARIVEGKIGKVNLCRILLEGEEASMKPPASGLTNLLLGLGSAQRLEQNAGALKVPGVRIQAGGFQKDGAAEDAKRVL